MPHNQSTKRNRILTPDQVQSVLDDASNHDPQLVPVLAVQAFAGLRTSESFALDWREISLATDPFLVVRRRKTGASRRVALTLGAVAWLRPYAQPSGSLASFMHPSRRIAAAFRRQGITQQANLLRHTYGTYSYVLALKAGTPDRWAADLGLTRVHREHLYLPPDLLRDAEGYFAIMPR